MKTSYKFAVAMVGSATVGDLAVQALHAQAKLPAYINEALSSSRRWPDLHCRGRRSVTANKRD